jgi:hypothetical protein
MLPDSIITVMAENCARNLLMEGAVRGDRTKLVRTVRRAIVEEMRVAEELEAEAEKVIQAHMGQVRAEGADIFTLKEKILAQLAKEKGVVLK